MPATETVSGPDAAAPIADKSVLTQLRESFLDWDLYKKAFPDLLKTGLPNTLILALASGIIGTILGMLLAVAGISRTRWLRWPARVYTDIFRGLPAVVIILIIGLGVGPIVKGITGSNPYWLGVAALSLLASAYIGEIFRSGIQSVESGQLEASRALGFSYRKSMSLVVIPQGVRRVLPALMNQFISLIKDSSLVSVISVQEILYRAQVVGRPTFQSRPLAQTYVAEGAERDGRLREAFKLANDPPRVRPQSFDNGEKTRQRVLVDGLDCLPGQLDLFD